MDPETPVPVETKNTIDTPLPKPPIQKRQKSTFLFICLFFILSVLVGYLFYQNSLLKNQRIQSMNLKPNAEMSQPTMSDESNTTWVDEQISFYDTTERSAGTYTVHFVRPENWVMTKGNTTTSADHLLQPCTSYTISDPESILTLTYEPICGSWSGNDDKTTLSADTKQVFQQKRNGNSGSYTLFRYRNTIDETQYRYIDLQDYENQQNEFPFGSIILGFAPPNENTGDFYFKVAKLTVTFSHSPNELTRLLQTADQIAGSFKLIPQNSPSISGTPAVEQTQKILNYFLPPGWQILRDPGNTIEIGFDPENVRMCTNPSLKEIHLCNKTSYGYASYVSVRLYPYSGGSRHQFIYSHLATPQKQDYLENYQESEFMWNGHACLFLNGIQYSQSPLVWGMCVIDDTQALLFTSFDRDARNYEKYLQGIRILK